MKNIIPTVYIMYIQLYNNIFLVKLKWIKIIVTRVVILWFLEVFKCRTNT